MFAQTLADNLPTRPFVVLSETESSNNYAMAKLHAGLLVDGCCVLALSQTAGKGQRGRQWLGKAGENITMTTVLQPASYKPFVYSAAIALGCYDFIKGFGAENVSIKWPNDIYIGDRKAAGILIENMYRGNLWEWAVVGTGINLNQEQFPEEIRGKACSIRQSTGTAYELVPSARQLHRCILFRHTSLKGVSAADVMNEYNSLLFRRGESVRVKEGPKVFNTVIQRVEEDGTLVTIDGVERNFSVGQVEFIL